VLVALTDRIESILSAHASSLNPDRKPEKYKLVSRVSHVGIALWVFAREATTAGRIGKALDAKLGLWRLGMGNKGAVGVRVPIMRGKDAGWETLTFVSAHLEAHDHNLAKRNAQYDQILSSLIFYPGDALQAPAQPHQSSHLFIMGDLNYRLERLPTPGVYPQENIKGRDLVALEKERAELVLVDTLKKEQRAGRVFGGMREGDLTRFAPTYKRIVGEVEGYSKWVFLDNNADKQKEDARLDGPYPVCIAHGRPGAVHHRRPCARHDHPGGGVWLYARAHALRPQAGPCDPDSPACPPLGPVAQHGPPPRAASSPQPPPPRGHPARGDHLLEDCRHYPRQPRRLALDHPRPPRLWQREGRHGRRCLPCHGVERLVVWRLFKLHFVEYLYYFFY